MFNNLIESHAHTAEFKRKGSFLFGTMAVYALLLLAAGVASIYAYEARLDSQSLEMTSLVTMVPLTPAPPKDAPRSVNHQTRPAANPDSTAQVPMRTERVSRVDDMTAVPKNINITGSSTPPAPPDATIGSRNIDVRGSGTSPFSGDGGPGGYSTVAGTGGHDVVREVPPPPEMPKVEPKPRQTKPVSIGVIESKVIHKAVPPYPPLAKQVRASGRVPVEILLDEQGHVISARATGGHPLLQEVAVRAAYQTTFSPTLLSNVPVKVTGVITFNFVLQ